jgi:hypothetical protein
MKEFTDIDQVALNQLRDAERGGEGAKLPFPALNIWVNNGDARMKAAGTTCPMLYFGGWATDGEALGELILAGHVPSDLEKWTAFEGAGDRGGWQGRGSRTVTAAFIASRTRWLAPDGKSAGPHFDAAKGFKRQHVQWLTLLYILSKPWGYAVLTAKGYQAMNVANALKDWGAAIAPHRAALNAQSLPLSAFALTIGTVGPEPVWKEVGKSATSKITPMVAVIPPDLDSAKVAQRFIGANNVRVNNERLAAAADWLAAWGKAGKDTTAPDDIPAEIEQPF